MGRLENKVALITGSTKGIGRSSAILFAKEGAKVVVTGYEEELGREVVGAIKSDGGEAIFVKGDVSQSDDVRRVIKSAIDTYGKLDVLYNNAGVWWRQKDGPVTDVEEQDWHRILQINLDSVYLYCKYGIPELLKNGGGSIINTSSILGLVGFGDRDAYIASKGAIISLTRSIAVRFGPDKIRANVLCPGTIATPMIEEALKDPQIVKSVIEDTPLRKIGVPEDIAYAGVYLASDESSFVTGSIMVVDGGYTAA